jgi:hypothetical protein
MSLAESRAVERLDIGQTLQDVLNVLTRNFGPLALLGVVLAGVPASLINAGRLLAPQNGGFAVLGILGAAASLVTRPILLGAVIFLSVRALDGEPASLGAGLAAGRRRWGTMLGLLIWSGLLTLLGAIFAIVPGIILALRWAIAGPVIVFGGRGIQDSMDRSAKLTQGRRWAIFLVYAIIWGVLICLAVLLGIIETTLTSTTSILLVSTLLEPLLNVGVEIGTAVVAAALYRRLRGAADGPQAAALAEVFA